MHKLEVIVDSLFFCCLQQPSKLKGLGGVILIGLCVRMGQGFKRI